MTTKNTAINTAKNTAQRGPDPIRSWGLTWAWSGVDFRPIRRWRGLFAALLIVLGAATAAPEQAAAQTETTLVSNTGQTSTTNNNATGGRAQLFTTGTHAAGYTLNSIEIVSSDSHGDGFDLSIWAGDSQSPPGYPEVLFTTLTAPSSFAAGTLTFTAPANTTLGANTKYNVVVQLRSTESVDFAVTAADAEDSGAAAGWSIHNNYFFGSGTSWNSTGSANAYQIAVKGSLKTGTNAAPTFADTTLTRSIAENTAADANVGAVIPAATDTDTGDTLTYSMEGTDAASFNFNATTGQITTKAGVTYDFETKSSYSVTIKVSDQTDSDTVAVTINLTDVNEPPSAPAAPTVAATSGSTTSLDVSWTAPANSGKPAITSYDLQYRAGSSGSFTDGPQDVTGTSTAIASLNAGTSYQVQVRATNDEGDSGWSGSGSGSTSTTTPTNNVPVLENPIPDQVAAVGAAFFYFIPSTTFSDADSDTLSYAATKADGMDLPTWLSFNPAANRREFTGTPAATDVGIVSVKVTASDSNGGSVSDVFDITVEEDTTPPTLTSATVNANGTGILLGFTERVSGSSARRPPASAFTVTADGIAVPAITINLGLNLALAIKPVFIRQGQVVVITYTDPTTGDDTLAAQDTAGNDAASFTTGMNSVPAVINNSTLAAVAPDAPTGLTATASGTDTINLSWTAPVDNGGRIITGYKIEVSIDSGTTWTDLVADTASTTTTYEHTGLAASTTPPLPRLGHQQHRHRHHSLRRRRCHHRHRRQQRPGGRDPDPGPDGDGGRAVQLRLPGHHVYRRRQRRHADLHGDEG